MLKPSDVASTRAEYILPALHTERLMLRQPDMETGGIGAGSIRYRTALDPRIFRRCAPTVNRTDAGADSPANYHAKLFCINA